MSTISMPTELPQITKADPAIIRNWMYTLMHKTFEIFKVNLNYRNSHDYGNGRGKRTKQKQSREFTYS